jgi:3-isopropylmalate/(R)-2-methylmalate dehydratase small subunit
MTEPTPREIDRQAGHENTADGGRAWVFGDDVNTDLLAPGRYMKYGIDAIAAHCLEALDPAFPTAVRRGDVLFAGKNFGAGSSREQAVEVLRYLGVSCVVAVSYAGLFYRNGFNLGLPLLISADALSVSAGQRVVCDLATASVAVPASGHRVQCEPIPPHLIQMASDGGLIPHLERKIAMGLLNVGTPKNQENQP